MQQFTVPQFIDVENKIIGPVTTRQFLIILGAAMICGIAYRLFDFSLFITVTVVVLGLASVFSFVKVNGRPFHFFILNIVQTIRRPRLRVWNSRAVITEIAEKSFIKPEVPVATKEHYQTSHLAELALIVDTKGKYKGE